MKMRKKLSIGASVAMVCLTATLVNGNDAAAYNLMSLSYADQEDIGDVTYYISEEHFEEGSEEIEWVIEGVEAWNAAPEVNVTRVDDRYEADVIITTSSDRPVFTNGQLLYGIANREIVILYDSLIEDEETYISTVTHEFGHSLGLHHSNEDGSVMLAYIEPGVGITDDDLAGITAIYDRQQEIEAEIENEEVWMGGVFMDYQPIFQAHDDYMDYQHIQYTMNPAYQGISIDPFEYLMYDSYNMGIPTGDVYFEVEQILVGETGEELPFEVTEAEDGTEIYQFLVTDYDQFNDLVLIGGELEGSEEDFVAELEQQESDHLYVKQTTSTLQLIDDLYSHLELENPDEIGGEEGRPEVSIRDYDPSLSDDERTLENYREVFEAEFPTENEGSLELLGTVEGLDHTENFYDVSVSLRGYDVYKFTDENDRFMSYSNENNEVMFVLFDLAVENGTDVNLYDYDVVQILFDDMYSPARGESRYLPEDLQFESLVGEAEYRFVPGVTEFPLLALVDAEQQEFFESHGGHIFLNRGYAFDGDSSIRSGDPKPLDFVLDASEMSEDPYLVDILVANNMAEKEIVEELSSKATLETEAVDVSVTAVELSNLTPLPTAQAADVTEGDAAIVLEVAINNKSGEAIYSRDMYNSLLVDGTEYSPITTGNYFQLIEDGTEGVAYYTYIVPADAVENYSSLVFDVGMLSDVMMNNLINHSVEGRELNLTE